MGNSKMAVAAYTGEVIETSTSEVGGILWLLRVPLRVLGLMVLGFL